VAELVPKEKIYNALALNNGANNIARIAAPALAGFLIGLIGTQASYFAGLTFNFVAITTISFLPPTSAPELISERSFKESFKEGFLYIRFHSILLVLLCMELVLALFGMSYQGLIPVFAYMLKVSPEVFGLMMSAIGIGALIGAFSVASLGNFKRKGQLLIAMGVVFGMTLVIFGNSGRIGEWLNLGANICYLAAFWLVIVGFSSAAYTTTSMTIIQIFVNDQIRGRITSIHQMVASLSLVSYALSGALAEALGASMALTVTGGCLAFFMLNVGAFIRRFPTWASEGTSNRTGSAAG
jgi:predicted MFS family arabinose efflux permease